MWDLWQAHDTNLVDNLSEGIHKIKSKYGHDNEKCETCKIKYKNCKCCLKYIRDDLIEYKCLWCNNKYQKKFDENLKKRFANTYKFSNHHIIPWYKFILFCKNVFTNMNTWMTGKNSMKHHYLRKKIFAVT